MAEAAERREREVLDDLPNPIFETSQGMQNEDLILCRKIRERRERLGLDGTGIYCDVDVRIGHIGVFPIYPMWQGDRYGTLMDLGNGHFTPLFAMDPEGVPDLDETLAEMERCAGFDHRGIVFSQDPSAFGLPALMDRHWDPMWAAAQEWGWRLCMTS